MMSPTDLEETLDYVAKTDKPYRAMKRIQELHSQNALPPAFLIALNVVYFGQQAEPGGAPVA